MPNYSLLAETRVTDLIQPYQEVATSSGGITVGTLLVGLLVVTATLSGAVWFLRRPPAPVPTPAGLLDELCLAHGINHKGRRLLHQIAQQAAEQHPGVLLISEQHFKSVVARAQTDHGVVSANHEQLNRLCRQLFGST